MAITILDTPVTYSTFNDDLWFVTSSTNSGTTNFKFVYDILVNGNLVSRTKSFPDVSGYGIFNSAPIVRAFNSNYFEPSGSSILVESNDKLKINYVLEVREEVSGSIAVFPDASGSYSAYNYTIPLFADEFKTDALNLVTYEDALLTTSFSDNLLTERGEETEIEFGDNFYVSYWKKTGGTYIAKVDVINEGNTIGTSVSGVITLGGEFNLFNLKATNVNTWAGSTIITSSTFGYDFYIFSATNSRKIKLRQKCNSKYESYNLHFLNRVGGYDTMKFGLVNKRNSEYEKSYFRRNEWQLTGSNMSKVDSYNRYNESNINYNIQHKNSYHLISNWVSGQDYEWLAQLVSSPIVYMEVQGAYFPVTIVNNNYNYKLEISDKLFNFEIDVEVGKKINGQFR
jgi:hypothetical protein